MTKNIIFIALAFAGVLLGACNPQPLNPTPKWEFPDDSTETGGKDTTKAGEKRYYLWVDAAANFKDFADSKMNIKRDLGLAADAGFTDVVIDVRPTNGNVLFTSRRGTPLTWVTAWVNGVYSKVERHEDFDYLKVFIDEGHALGLRVHAAINTMVGGNSSGLGNSGLLFDDKTKKDWAETISLRSGLYNAMDVSSETTKFLNPNNAEVQEYLISLIEDLAAYKALDGIVLDRCRFTSLQSDFSQISKEKFAEYISPARINNWPQDVLAPGADYNTVNASGWQEPRLYKQWLAFRAKTIHDFVERASNAAHAKNSDILFGVYVGGWYSQYYDVGVNWASPNYATHTYFPKWANADYCKYGYADHCDHMLIGAYASPGYVYGPGEWTMQGFCNLAKKKIGSACPIVCGGPDVGNWDSENRYTVTDYHNAVQLSPKVCADACDGYFCFDMIHLKMYDYWPYIKEGIKAAKEKK